jgi:uncharacterized protein
MMLFGLIGASLAMLPGVAGVILPGLPGIPYMLIVAILYGFITKFATLSLTDFWWLAIIAIASLLIDYLAGMLGAKFAGTSKRATLAGFIGLVLGTILLPPFGGLIFMFFSILGVELWAYGKGEKKALQSASGAVLGSLTGILLNLTLALGFIALFVIVAIH